MELHHATAQQEADDLNGFILARASGAFVLAQPLELLGHPGQADSQGDAVIGNRGYRAQAFGLQQRLAHRQSEYRGKETDIFGYRCHGRNSHPGVQHRCIEGPEAGAIRCIGVGSRDHLWKKWGVGDLDAVPAAGIGRAGDVLQLGRVYHKGMKPESHSAPFPLH